MNQLTMPAACSLLMAGLMSAALGCTAGERRVTIAVSLEQREALRARALEEFDHAIFYKPRPDSASGTASELAPLVVQRVLGNDQHSVERNRLSGPTIIEASSFSGCSDEPGVGDVPIYTGETSIQLGGKRFDQVVYLWAYPQTAARTGVRWQGIRITWGTDGFPLAWEVLASQDGIKRLFVSASLERAAAAEFGGPLPGRRFAVERSFENAPDAVVMRIIEDGPIPMGPFVYVDARNHEVTTVLCRCSPSQVSRFVETLYYCLQPLEHLEDLDCDLPEMPESLARCLRWPDSP